MFWGSGGRIGRGLLPAYFPITRPPRQRQQVSRKRLHAVDGAAQVYWGLGMLGHLVDSMFGEALLLLTLPILAIRFLLSKLFSIRLSRLGISTEAEPALRRSSRKLAFARAIAAYEELIDLTAHGSGDRKMGRHTRHQMRPRATGRVRQA